jgi:hypothetical protein
MRCRRSADAAAQIFSYVGKTQRPVQFLGVASLDHGDDHHVSIGFPEHVKGLTLRAGELG